MGATPPQVLLIQVRMSEQSSSMLQDAPMVCQIKGQDFRQLVPAQWPAQENCLGSTSSARLRRTGEAPGRAEIRKMLVLAMRVATRRLFIERAFILSCFQKLPG